MSFFTKEHQEAMERINGKGSETKSKHFSITQFEISEHFYIDSKRGEMEIEDISALREFRDLITAVIEQEGVQS